MMTEQEATVWARERIARGRLSKPNSKKRDREMRRYRASHGGMTPLEYSVGAKRWDQGAANWLWQTS
jgi:hypothetical protein